MDQTKSMSNKIPSLVQPAVDFATFIGSGLLARAYSTIWVNDPTTKSGIVFAALLNAATLGISNHLVNKETPLHYKAIFTVVTLAGAAFAAPYLTILLKDRLAIILTKEAALQIGVLNLVTKALTYALSSFGSRIILPTAAEEIKSLSTAILKRHYDFFQTEKGKIEWQKLSEGIRRGYASQFFENNFPVFSFDDAIIKEMFFSQNPNIIKAYTKVQASWIHKIISSQENLAGLSKTTCEAYVTLFYANDLPPFPQLPWKRLPVLTEDGIKNLTSAQSSWYKLLASDRNFWISFSLPLQQALNDKFAEYNIPALPLCHSSAKDLGEAPKSIIERLYEDVPGSWLTSTLKFQEELNQSFNFHGLDPYPTHPKTVGEVAELTPEIIRAYHQVYSSGKDAHPFSPELEMAFSLRFIESNLLPPTNNWTIDYEGFLAANAMNPNPQQIALLETHFSNNPMSWKNLPFSNQIKYNEILSRLNKHSRPYHPHTAQNIEADEVTRSLHLQYTEFHIELWNDLSLELQLSLNTMFNKRVLSEIKVTKEDVLENWSSCSPAFQRSRAIKCYDYFQTEEGKDHWKKETKEHRVAYLNLFFQGNFPYFADEDVKEMSIPNTSDQIKQFTPHQAMWLQAHLNLCVDPAVLPKEVSQACVDLFYKNDLPPLPKIANQSRISPRNFTLPLPIHNNQKVTPLDGFRAILAPLTHNQTEWYQLYAAANWSSFTLELQTAFNEKFRPEKLAVYYLIPSSAQNIQTCPLPMIQKLAEKYRKIPDDFLKDCTPEMQVAFYKRSYELFQTEEGNKCWVAESVGRQRRYLEAFFALGLPFVEFDKDIYSKLTFSTDPEKLKNYTENQAKWLHNYLSNKEPLNLTFDTSNAYVALFYKNNLPPPQTIDRRDAIDPANIMLPIPKDCSEITKLTANQTVWYKYFTDNAHIYSSFSLELKHSLNLKFAQHGMDPWGVEALTVENIQQFSDSFIHQLYAYYDAHSKGFDACPLDIFEAFIPKYHRICHAFFQTEQGKLDWATINADNQLHQLTSFFKLDLPFIALDGDLLKEMPVSQNPEEIKLLTANQANWMIKIFECTKINITDDAWEAYARLFYSFFQTEQGKLAWATINADNQLHYLNSFFILDLPFVAFDGDLLKEMPVSQDPEEITLLTANQATWIDKILECQQQIVLSDAAADAYNKLFLKYAPN